MSDQGILSSTIANMNSQDDFLEGESRYHDYPTTPDNNIDNNRSSYSIDSSKMISITYELNTTTSNNNRTPINDIIKMSGNNNTIVNNNYTTNVGLEENVESPFMDYVLQIMLGLHLIVFISGLIGNTLVCLSVYRNKSLQTVTNYFIVNLAVADFLVILICLPPTVYWDIYLTWSFGLALCKLVTYLQVSILVRILIHGKGFIDLEALFIFEIENKL